MESSHSDRLNFWQMAKLPGLRWFNDAPPHISGRSAALEAKKNDLPVIFSRLRDNQYAENNFTTKNIAN